MTKTVNDRAVLSCDYNISTDELTKVRIYWQKNNSDMVLSVVSGKMQVWPKYKNRTVANIISNPFIVILGLRPSDNGTYTCVIQKPERGAYRVGHLTSVMLSVTGQWNFLIYSKPANSSCLLRYTPIELGETFLQEGCISFYSLELSESLQ